MSEMTMPDAETLFRNSKRPLVLGIGGGGDVVGALATAEFARLYDGADPVLGGLTWERRPIDPLPGPRSAAEIADGTELVAGVLLARPETRVRATGTRFAESQMAEFLGTSTLLVDVGLCPEKLAERLSLAMRRLGCDLIVGVDVGGDVLAPGGEVGLRSPLCDALMLAALSRLSASGHPALLGIFGIGCDGELTTDEALARISEVGTAGGIWGTRGLTPAVAARLEAAASFVHTEASALPARAFRGVAGPTTIRDGACVVQVSAMAPITFFLDPVIAMESTARLARAVADAKNLQDANRALNALGVRTELDLELAASARGST